MTKPEEDKEEEDKASSSKEEDESDEDDAEMKSSAEEEETPSSPKNKKAKKEEKESDKDEDDNNAMEVDNDDDDSKKPTPMEKPTWPIEEESDEEEGVDYFARFKRDTSTSKNKTSKASKKRKLSTANKPLIAIKLANMADDTSKKQVEEESGPTAAPGQPALISPPSHAFPSSLQHLMEEEDIIDSMVEDLDLEEGLEDSLEFFSRPHEDQDPNFLQFQKSQREKAYSHELNQLEFKEKEAEKKITELIQLQRKEKQASTEASVQKYRLRTDAEERKDIQRLQQMYSDKVASQQMKINQGIETLRRRHQEDTRQLQARHQQQVQQGQIHQNAAEQHWQTFAQRLRAKQSAQTQEFIKRGEDVKKKVELEFAKDKEQIRAQYAKRRKEIDANGQTIYHRINSGFQLLCQRYLKRHAQKVAAAKAQLMEKYKDVVGGDAAASKIKAKEERHVTTAELAKEVLQERPELQPPLPCKTECNWQQYSSHEKSGSAARHKHRKGVLSQLNKQLSVEIHNEGMWISTIVDKSDSEEKKKSGGGKVEEKKPAREFIPWGIKAREILGAIICGEIPSDFGVGGFEFNDTSEIYGSHIRCVMTDLRTSEDTASNQRAAAVQEYENASLAELEKNAVDMTNLSKSAEKSLAKVEAEEKSLALKTEDATKNLENAKASYSAFRTKFSRYLGPDDNPLPTTKPEDGEKLRKAVHKGKTGLEYATRAYSSASKQLLEAKSQTSKYQAMVKQAQRAAVLAQTTLKKKKALIAESKRGPRSKGSEILDLERANVRVKETISVLNVTAEKRREQLNQKRSNSHSTSWVQSLPGVPGSLKKSLWHKMHRRRQQIVLRPSFESLMAGLGKAVADNLSASKRYIGREATEEFLLKAEQRFLHVAHPVKPVSDDLSSVPSGNSDWAEPGWYVDLSVPKKATDSILPCPPSFHLLHRNICEISSAPGRQAASMICDTDLRCLTSHLSAVATATSLAETDPSVATMKGVTLNSQDPLRTSQEGFKLGYDFVARAVAPAKPTPASRRRSSTSKDAASGGSGARKSSAASNGQAAGSPSTPATKKPPAKRKAPSTSSRTPAKRRASTTASTKPSAAANTVKPTSQPAPVNRQASASASAVKKQQQGSQYSQQYMQSTNNQPSQTQPAQAQQQQRRPSYPQQINPNQRPSGQMQQQQQQQPPPYPNQQAQQHPHPHPHPQIQSYPNPQHQQMNQMRMMAPPGQQGQYVQPMQQFYNPMHQPPQQFPQQPIQMPNPMGSPNHHQQGQMPMNNQGGNNKQNPSGRSQGDDQNDPLFMLK